MKLITKLFDLKWYKVLPILLVIMTTIVFSFYKLVTIGSEGSLFNDNLFLLKISFTLAIPFSFLFIMMNGQMKKNEAFWDRAHKVEEEIDAAETKEELIRILNEEISYETGVLRKMSSGLPHHQKIREMYKVLETKAKYVS